MQAVVLRGGKLVVAEVAEPTPGSGEVLVKSRGCGICGSDLHAVQHLGRIAETSQKAGGYFAADPDKDMVMGHEFCAEVVSYGPDTEGSLAPGTLVTSMPVLMGEKGMRPVGYSNETVGGFAQYMCLMEQLLMPIPEGLAVERAALTEPLAVGIHAVNKSGVTDADAAVVIGCGPVGLAVVGALKLKGIRPIIASDFSPLRRRVAVDMGADVAVDPREESPYARFRDLAKGGSAPGARGMLFGTGLKGQVVFECVGVPGVLQEVFESAETGARVVVAGVCLEPDTTEPFYAISKELAVQYILGYDPAEFGESLEIIAGGRLPVEKMVTGTVGLSGVAEAFRDLANPEGHIKVIVDPWAD